MIVEAIWSSDKNAYFKSKPNHLISDIRGKVIETINSPLIKISGEVIYLNKQKNNYEEINLKTIN